MAGAIAAAVVGATVAVATTATTIGVQESNKAKASAAAQQAQAADARERARQEQDAQSKEMAGIVMGMMAPADPMGDPAMNQLLAERGYAPGGAQGSPPAPGTPSTPPDPSTPRQQMNGGGNFGGGMPPIM